MWSGMDYVSVTVDFFKTIFFHKFFSDAKSCRFVHIRRLRRKRLYSFNSLLVHFFLFTTVLVSLSFFYRRFLVSFNFFLSFLCSFISRQLSVIMQKQCLSIKENF